MISPVNRSVTILTVLAVGLLSFSASAGDAPLAPPGLVIDGRLEDWSVPRLVAISSGPLRLALSKRYLFFQMSFEAPRLLQEDDEGTSTLLWIDRDADPATGCGKTHEKTLGAPVPAGSEMVFALAAGRGIVCRGSEPFEINFASLGLVVAPSVKASDFELALDRRAELSAWLLDGPKLRVGTAELMDGEIVSNVSLQARLGTLQPNAEVPTLDLARPPGSLRLVAYNVESDGLLDPDSERRQSLGRVFRALDPDVLGLQEAYRSSAEQVRSKLIELTGFPDWRTVKEGQDLVLASRHPIRRSRLIHRFEDYGAAAAFEVALPAGVPGAPEKPLTILLAHWPCCNEQQPPSERQRLEIAQAMVSFLDRARSGEEPWPIERDAPVVAMGDLNLVVSRKPLDVLITGAGLRVLALRHSNAPFVSTWRDDESRFGPGQLDYVLVSPGLEADHAFALATETLPQDILRRWGLQARDTAVASDHLPLVADLRFERR